MLPGMLPTSVMDQDLRRRAMDALDMRNQARMQQAREQNQPLSAWDLERPDPNLGNWNVILQGLQEAGGQGFSTTGGVGAAPGVSMKTPKTKAPTAALQGLYDQVNTRYPGWQG